VLILSIKEILNGKALSKKAKIGIGIGQDKSQNNLIASICSEFAVKNKCEIEIIGKAENIEELSDNIKKNKLISLIKSNFPEKKLIELLIQNKLNAIIRGSLSSSNFLKEVKDQFNIDEILRLALLETYDKQQFFYGPVGIDECNNLNRKKMFLENAIKILKNLGIEPKISILSGGRLGDLGRDPHVDETIKEAWQIIEYFSENAPNISIFHDQILIENSVYKTKANLIIAPDGISGNLIYRTLVHLGGGNAYGAIYMNLERTIIDTSRVGKPTEIKGALMLALAFSS